MDFSETIIAAMIGAGATVATATFQLFTAFRSRKADYRPKRSSGFRSALAVLGLVLGAAVAGFAYSELRMEREREDTRAMEQRISDRLQALANVQLAQHRDVTGDEEATLLAPAGASHAPARSEAMMRLAACRSRTREYGNEPGGCDAANANRAALCASVPPHAEVLEVELFARADGSARGWEQSRVSIDQDIDGARFVGTPFEVDQGSDQKAICADFVQWNSERGHEARIVVAYAVGSAIAAPKEPSPGPVHGGLPTQAPDTEAVTEAVAAVPKHARASDIVPTDLAAGAAKSGVDPPPRAGQVAIAPQP
jgi:hypothetical protein